MMESHDSQSSLMSLQRVGSAKDSGGGGGVNGMAGPPTISVTNSFNSLKGIKKKFKRSPKSTSELEKNKEEDEEQRREEQDYEVQRQLKGPLLEVSRQRLRAIKMGMRKYSNVDSRITSAQLQQVFQENHIKISGRTFQIMVETYEDSFGIDFERMWRTLVVAQSNTGRDSVLAQNRRNESSRTTLTRDQKDDDLVRRLEKQLLPAKGSYDVPGIRADCQQKDENKAGKLPREEVSEICAGKNLPVYGALLTSLLNRCDDEQDGKVSWPEFMSFLEKAHANIGGNSAKTTSASETESGTDGTDTPRNSATPAQNRKNAGNKDGGKGKKDGGVTPRQKRRGQGKKGASDESDVSSDGPGGTPVSDRNGTAAMDKISEEKGGGTDATTAEQDKSPRERLKKALLGKVKDGNVSPRPDAKSVAFANVIPAGGSSAKSASSILSSVRARIMAVEGKNKADATGDADSKVAENEGVAAKSRLRARLAQSPRTNARGLKSVEQQIENTTVTFWPPDDFSDANQNMDPPQQRLKLEWVYGYRGNDCRSNLYVLTTGEVIYFIGTVAVVHDRHKVLQRHYREHTQEIRSMAVHPNGLTVATGQGVHKDTPPAQGQATVRVWRSDTLQTVHVLGADMFHRAVICLAFSTTANDIKAAFVEPPGTYSKDRLCAVDCSEGHMLSVWDSTSGKCIASTQLSVDVMCDTGFNPMNADVIVTVGKDHIGWWTVFPEQGAMQQSNLADYGNNLRARFVTCMMHNDKGDLITGDTNGTVYVWKHGGNTISNFIKHGHEGPVFGLLLTRGTLLTAGRDGHVYAWIWSKNMDKCGAIKIPEQEGGVRMLQLHKDALLIGTTTNSILLVTLAGAALKSPLADVTLESLPFTQGHFDRALGVCTVRSENKGHTPWVMTSGADGILSLIDTSKKQPIWKVMPKKTPASCIDAVIDDEGTMVVVGSRDSVVAFEILNDEERGVYCEEMCRFKVTKGRITTIRLSPDSHYIAAGDTTGAIHMLEWRANDDGDMHWELAGTCEGHQGGITGLDWSAQKHSGVYILRSSSDAIQLLHWNPHSTGCISNAEDLRNLPWSSQTCLLGHSISGLWFSKQVKDSKLVAVDVNAARTLVAAGVESGHMGLFRHPCGRQGAYSHTYKAHPSLRNLIFTKDGKKVITIGGKDSCTMQWTLV